MNLGNGNGFSVFEVIQAVESVTGRSVAYEIEGRRPGDPARLVADATLAKNELDWNPRYRYMDSIIQSAWRFHRQFMDS